MEEEKGVKQDMEEEGETFLRVEVEEEEKTIIKEEQLEETIWPCLLSGESWLDLIYLFVQEGRHTLTNTYKEIDILSNM